MRCCLLISPIQVSGPICQKSRGPVIFEVYSFSFVGVTTSSFVALFGKSNIRLHMGSSLWLYCRGVWVGCRLVLMAAIAISCDGLASSRFARIPLCDDRTRNRWSLWGITLLSPRFYQHGCIQKFSQPALQAPSREAVVYAKKLEACALHDARIRSHKTLI